MPAVFRSDFSQAEKQAALVEEGLRKQWVIQKKLEL